MSLVAIAIFSVVGLVLAFVTVFVLVDVILRKSGSGILLLAALAVLFLGERVLGEGDWRLPVSALGIVGLFGALGLRVFTFAATRDARKQGHRLALLWSLVVVASLALYGLTLDSVTGLLGLDEDGVARWNGVWKTLFPIGMLLGFVPIFELDRLLGVHPVIMPAGAARSAQIRGVAGALAIALVFPVNYIAKQKDKEWDLAYFRTTRPGESTLAMVKTSAEPVEATLFFPAGSDVAQQVAPYFNQLASGSDGRFTVKVVDQALDPKLAEDLKVRDNGEIVFKQGESTEKFKVDLKIDKAKRDLKKLDSIVQKHLMKLTRGQRVVYFLGGHGEANWRESEEPLRKLNLYKKDILEAQNFKVKTFGVADGSTVAVPDDADVVVVAAPLEPLLPEEVETLKRWFDGGGTLLVMVDPKGDPMADLLAHIGVEAGTAVLANAEAHVRQSGGPADNILIGTNKYGSHASVKTLSRNSQVAYMVLPASVFVQKAGQTTNKVTTLIRTMPGTWQDSNGNFEADPDEAKKVYELAVAATKDVGEGEAKKEARAVVVGGVAWLSDEPLRSLRANQQFGYDAIRWLTRDEDIAGEVESEEDVKVQHSQGEDWMWFLTAIFAVPAMVLGAGVVFVQRRRRDR